MVSGHTERGGKLCEVDGGVHEIHGDEAIVPHLRIVRLCLGARPFLGGWAIRAHGCDRTATTRSLCESAKLTELPSTRRISSNPAVAYSLRARWPD